MKSRGKSFGGLRELNNLKNRKSENLQCDLSQENELPPKIRKEAFKLRTLTITGPYVGIKKERIVQRYSHQPQIAKSLTITHNSFDFEKSQASSNQFYLPTKTLGVKKESLEEANTLGKSRIKKYSHSQTLPLTLNSRQKVKISQFLLGFDDSSRLQANSSTQSKTLYKPANSLSGNEIRPSTTTVITRPSLTTDQVLIFKTKLFGDELRTSGEKLKHIKSLGPYKKRLTYQAGFMEVKGSQTSPTNKANKRPEEIYFPKNFWFVLNHDICTKTKLEYEVKKLTLDKKEINKKIIEANQHNLMICLDSEGQNSQLKYCFIRRKVKLH